MNNHDLICQPKGSHFINGKYVDDFDGEVLECKYPATGDVVARLNYATKNIVDAAIHSSVEAQRQWIRVTQADRGRILRKAAEIIRSRNSELARLETYNTGKPINETEVADAATGADSLEYFGGLAGSMTGKYIDLGSDFAYTRREPLGVCAGLGAWNYPAQIACWKAAPALACGNAMVFKPSELTPLTALKVAEIFIEAGAPAGLFNVIQGEAEVGKSLCEDKRIAKVSLTGSVPTGKKVAALAASTMKYITMELGGKSPLIIFEDADLDRALEGAMVANFFASGQVCSNGTRVFVHTNVYNDFINKLNQSVSNLKVGDPLNKNTEMGPVISQSQLDIINNYVRIGSEEGANKITSDIDLPNQGYWVSPVIFADVTDDMTIAREEIFGPVMSVLKFDNEAEVISRANNTQLGLSAGLYTRNIDKAHRVAAKLEAGCVWINSYNLTPVEVPFGGYKDSGVGRENSHAAIEYYSQIKTIYVGMEE